VSQAAAIPIIGGTGALGSGLALRLAAAGREVVIGSRDAFRAEEAAARIRGQARNAHVSGAANEEAATRGPILFLTVPFRNQSENLTNLKTTLTEGQIVVDATVPLAAAVSGKATRLLGVPQGSAAEQAQDRVPDGVTVISALRSVNAKALGDLTVELDEDVLVCGDRKDPKARVAELIELIPGLRAINSGALETARFAEALTPLLISVNVRNKTHAGIKLTGIPDERW